MEMKDEQVTTILCIDDQYEVIELAKLILQRGNYRVVSALGGKEGMRVAKEVIPDLILLDLMMHDLHGWDVYQHLKAFEATSHIPIIIVTAKSQSIDKVLGLHMAKADGYITKPFMSDELLENIEQVLSESQMKTAS